MYQVGLDCILYLDASGVGGSSWAAITDAQDVTVGLQHGKATVANRASDWLKTLLTHKELSIEFDLTFDPDDTEFQALRAAFTGKTDIGIAAYNEAIATVGAEGVQVDCKVVNFTRNEPVGDTVTVSVTLEPSAESSTEPAYTVIAA